MVAINEPSIMDEMSQLRMDLSREAANLLSQQIYCWGQDIKRPQGNWLLELGFTRSTPPSTRKDCSSVYTLPASPHQRIVLRGFGVFIGDDQKGGVFFHRYGFSPLYTKRADLECPPWSNRDLPPLLAPTANERSNCFGLVLDLIDWIREYEVQIVERLGVEYRRATLTAWNNGKRHCTPAEKMAVKWRMISLAVASDFESLLTPRALNRNATQR